MTKLIEITGKAIAGEWGEDDLTGNGIPVLRTTNFTNSGVINYDNIVTRTIKKKNIKDKLLKYGDIIIEKSGGSDTQPVGRVVFFEGEEERYLFNNFTGLLRVKDRELWNPKYVFYSLFSNYYMGKTLQFENRTTGLHNLQTDSYVSSTEIVCRGIKEQNKIVDDLDKVIQLIGLCNVQLENLNVIVKSRFIEMFGNPVVNPKGLKKVLLADLSELITKGASPNWQGFVYTDDNTQTLFVTSENVREGFLDLTTPKYIEDGFNEKQKRSLLRKGDFLINIVGASIGRAAQYNFLNKANINQAVALVRVKPNTIRDNYLLYYLNSEKAQRMYNAMKSDTGRANLSLQDIANLEILLPSIGEQDEFDLFMQQVDKSKLAVQKSLNDLETLKKSLMQQYFG